MCAVHISPRMKEIKPFGFNYHDMKQNSQDWFDLRIGKVTCSIIGSLTGLAGEKSICITYHVLKTKLTLTKSNVKNLLVLPEVTNLRVRP